jgi:hypothetical protein
MSLRMYLPSTRTAPVSPAYYATNKTSEADRIFFSPVKQGTVMTTKASTDLVNTNPYTFTTRQYVSDPLSAQTITGTVKGQIRAWESQADSDFCAGIVIRVVSGNGSSFRGTLLEYLPGSLTSEFSNSSLTNRYYPPSATALSDVTSQAGDRLVVDIITKSFNSFATTRTANHRFGDESETDLPENETNAEDYNPWLEFSMDISFQSDQLKIDQVFVEAELYDVNKLTVDQVFVETELYDVNKLTIDQIFMEVEYNEPEESGGLFFCHG